jgi:hypothetical protein
MARISFCRRPIPAAEVAGCRQTSLRDGGIPTLDEIGLYFFQRYPRLFASRFGDLAVPEILEPGSVLFQIDQNRYLTTFAIGYELNASHGSILHASHTRPAFLL